MAARDRHDLGTRAMEIASHARAFAVTNLRHSQPVPTAMAAMSILAMAMVICLFGGYVDSPNEQRISTAVRTICQTFIHKVEVTKRK
jgi:hypothetical protein